MMQLLRRILQSARPTLLFLLILGLILFFGIPGHQAKACWNIIEDQCFIFSPTVPPNWGSNGLVHPAGSGRYWWRYPNPPYDPGPVPPPPSVTWDIENMVFDNHMCPDNEQAIWCDGWPRSHDPRTDNYPAWDSAYVTYGPIDLSQGATAAACSFYLYNRTEVAQDSIFWGCVRGSSANTKKIHLQPRDSIYIAGVSSQIMNNQIFQTHTIDFAHLRNLVTGDTVSFLGSSGIYLFWRFWSNGNTNVNTGAFIDNVTVAWDDGGVDLDALTTSMRKMDSTLWSFPLVPFDSAWATFTYVTCSGGPGVYAPYEVVGLVDTMVVLDTIMVGDTAGMTITLSTRPWQLLPDSHMIRFVVDTLNAVQEVDETNNAVLRPYFVPPVYPPPTFIWTVPGDCTGTVYGDQTVVLKWESYHDPHFAATLSFGSNADGNTCLGITIPGATDIPVRDGPDSLVWELGAYSYGRTLYPFVWIDDPHNHVCSHAPFPVVRRQASAANDRPSSSIPEHFYLQQNFPNPFNPTTELHYGLAKGGHVTLTVYDVLGREVAKLVNGERTPGSYTMEFDGSTLPSGLYLYKLTTPEGTQSRKMMLMK